MRRIIGSAALAVVAGMVVLAQGPGGPGQAPGQLKTVEIGPAEECPIGTTLVRPGRCAAPAQPPPSIIDYRPRSTVVADDHLVPRAKFPVVDIHSHQPATADNMEALVKEMDALNIRVLVNLTAGSGERLREAVRVIRESRHADRFRVFANVSWKGAGTPGWAERAVAELDQALNDGAIGLKVLKDLGLHATKADGSRLRVDDPELDPIWQLCAKRNVPVLIHVADPAQFFEPIDYRNERWLELALFPNRHYPQDRFPSFETLMEERDRMFARNPKTRFINAHFGWHANDFERAARHLERFPNVYMEVGAVLYEFGRQPRAAHDFFVKYQDRILFGKDAWQPVEFPYFFRVFETTDEYFDYYRDYHATWKMYGMGLPETVLRKLYFENALKVTPGLPQTGWPQQVSSP